MNAASLVRRIIGTLAIGGIGVAATSCGEVARTGRSPAYLVIDVLEGDSGASQDAEFSTILYSDVQTIVEVQQGGQTVRVPTVFSDNGRVTFRLGLKNLGTPTAPLGPSLLNEVTVTRYRVVFKRSDGRNREGVDVPYAFEGGMTVTVNQNDEVQGVFDLVRHTNKSEPPLRNLIGGGGAEQINTVAEVTFFGRDMAGNEVTASGLITVLFSDFGDPR